MEEKKQGGKRRGAGRKPVLHKKKQFSFYVEGSKVLRFGSEEKFKKAVNDFIDGKDELNTEINYLPTSPNAYDGKKMDKVTYDEPAMWQEEKPKIRRSKEYFQQYILDGGCEDAEGHRLFISQLNESDLAQRIKDELSVASRIKQS